MIILLFCTLIAPQLCLMKCELCLKIILEQPETLDSSFQGFVCGTDLRTFYWSVSWTGTNQLCAMHLFMMIIVPILLSTSSSSSSPSRLWLSNDDVNHHHRDDQFPGLAPSCSVVHLCLSNMIITSIIVTSMIVIAIALFDTFWKFIFSLNRAEKWFNSKQNPKYSFKKIFIK